MSDGPGNGVVDAAAAQPPGDLATDSAAETGGDARVSTDAVAHPTLVIDTHTHFYDPTRAIPPGRDRSVDWPDKSIGPVLYRPILPTEYAAMAQPLGIGGTVVVEASSWLEDNDWILDQAAKNNIIVGYVGDFEEVWGKPAFDTALAKYRQNPLFRGVRTDVSAGLKNPQILANYKQMADADLMIDTRSAASDIIKVAQMIPNLRIVRDHLGEPDIKKTAPAWFTDMTALAQQPNVSMKVSGLVEAYGPMAPDDVEKYRKLLDHIFQAFGEDRVIYGTNWPVSDLGAPLTTVHHIILQYMADRGQEAVEKLYWKNAKAVYKWVQR